MIDAFRDMEGGGCISGRTAGTSLWTRPPGGGGGERKRERRPSPRARPEATVDESPLWTCPRSSVGSIIADKAAGGERERPRSATTDEPRATDAAVVTPVDVAAQDTRGGRGTAVGDIRNGSRLHGRCRVGGHG